MYFEGRLREFGFKATISKRIFEAARKNGASPTKNDMFTNKKWDLTNRNG